MNLSKYLHSSATMSSDRRYRYQLARSWTNDFGAYALWIGLNPSTADEEHNDPTLDNICRRTRRWGHAPGSGKPFVGIWLGNLYAWRSTDPLQLPHCLDPIGPNNDGYLADMIERSEMVICAWGNGPFNVRQQPAHMKRCRAVLQLVLDAGKTPYMLQRLTSGHPRHPLYWPEEAPAKVFEGYEFNPTNGKEDGHESRSTRTTEEGTR